MKINIRHFSPNRNTFKKAGNELNKFPLKYSQRRKSSIPLHIREFISNNAFNQINQECSTKNSYNKYSDKKCKDIINNSIPEVSENSSQNQEEKNKKKTKKGAKKETKNEIENNNYYIHYIKNVYEKEPHLSKESIIKSEMKKYNDNYMKYIYGKKNFRKKHRRNSEVNKYIFKSNLHNLNMDKEPIRKDKKSTTLIINKKQSNEIINHNNQNSEEKEKNRSNRKNKEKQKNKRKQDNKECKDNNIFHMIGDSPKKNNDTINTKRKEKEALENEKKTKNDNNNENKNVKSSKIMNKLKKFFCCLINNGESSIEKD